MPVTAYGFDVLDAAPNQRDDAKITFARGFALLDPGIGAREGNAKSGQPVNNRPYLWWLNGRPAVTSLKTFLAARKGRAVPFWAPGWRTDLSLANDVGPTDPSITITACNYTRFLYPSPARRYLCFLLNLNGATQLYRKVTAAVDNGNGTETLTLDTTLGQTTPAASTVVTFLRLCRLDADEIKIKWHTPEFAECEMPMVEVPAEVT